MPVAEKSIDAEIVSENVPTKRRRWHQWRTIRKLKRQMAKEHAVFKEWDRRDNDITRLPSTEAVT